MLKSASFKDLQNTLKEFEVLRKLNHPCICECLGMNPQEKVATNNDKSESKSEDEFIFEEDEVEKEKVSITKEITTVALFLEYHPFNLKQTVNESFMTNTLKAKIVVEIAFGMSHIHKNGMIHRDLKPENVMLNLVFEAKLIDFGLTHVDEMKEKNESLTKGIGTMAYMSPEMINEENYNNKTDVYSFGVLLFYLFTKHLPKQTMKDKLTNIQFRFPKPSSSMSAFCIQMIKKCVEFRASDRPSFDEIIDGLNRNSFALADEIDVELVAKRYRELNYFRMLNE